MTLLVASLYLLCLAFLFGSALYVYSRNPFSRLNSSYAVLAFSLLGWVGSLFIYQSETANPALLEWGRFNFAAAAVVAPAVYVFVAALARRPLRRLRWITVEGAIFVLLSQFTGAVDKSEHVLASGQHVTTYGLFFGLYAVHLVFFLTRALVVAFHPGGSLPKVVRGQLRLVSIGLLISAVIGITTNVVLPFFFDNFSLIDAGTIGTIFFLSTVAYATSVRHLFDIRVIVRTTVVFAVIIGLALEVYQAAVEFLTKLLPLGDPTERHVAAASVALTINSFTHDALRRWLEQLINTLWSGKPKPDHGGPKGDDVDTARS